ncbi:MAG: peptidoglycan DD-metalloendopeptidase family protein [Deltaproteobacteria bacterium]|nr:peptidoglycan DD-metalloendopeptidase family protein [Deltaproteobacteria bacterium]
MIAYLLASSLLAISAGSVLAELEQFDRRLVNTELQIQELESQRATLVVDIAGLSAEQATAKIREQEAFTNYRMRVRALARMPVGARVILLGNSSSLPDYLETSQILRWVATHDRKLHKKYLTQSLQLKMLKREIVSREQKLQNTIDNIRKQRTQLARKRQERANFLRSLLANRDSINGAAATKRQAHNNMSLLLSKLHPIGQLNEVFAKNKGKLPWPTAGKIGAGFGDTIEPLYGTKISHSGLDFLAANGTPVASVAAGNVVFAGWLNGYGQLIIIDHGNDYHTLYAHLSLIKVMVDDTVAQGAMIGAVGDTGSLTGTHLYFELRHQGIAQDPQTWLRR